MSSRQNQATVTTVTSTPRPKWCGDCKANSAAAVDLFALFPDGLTYITTVAACEICDDPADQEGAGRG